MFIARTRGDAGGIVSTLRREVAALDADVPLFNIQTLQRVRDNTRLQPRLIGTLLAAFAGIALLLSVLGLYSVTAYAVRQRTQEIGVRMALGAQPGQVVWLFVRRGAVRLGAGIGLGLAGAVGAGQLLRGALIETRATDPLTLVSIVTLLAAVALAACFIPARRAARLDPVGALRYE
jgi:putative ABC transport system permease protein